MSRTMHSPFSSGTADPAELWARLARDAGLPDDVDLTSEAMGGLADDGRTSALRAGPLEDMSDAGGVAGAMGGLCEDR